MPKKIEGIDNTFCEDTDVINGHAYYYSVKAYTEFNDSINGLNCADGLSYRHYSAIYDLGRKLADDEYNQGRTDEHLLKRVDYPYNFERYSWCRN